MQNIEFIKYTVPASKYSVVPGDFATIADLNLASFCFDNLSLRSIEFISLLLELYVNTNLF